MRTRVCVALIAAVLMTAGIARADEPSPAAVVTPGNCSAIQTPARVVHPADPQAPPLAVEQQLGGTVVVDVSLDERSQVQLARIVQSPWPILNSAALAAARTSIYATLERNCVARATVLRVPVVFPRPSATGAPPAIASDFLGTWTCTSKRNAVVVNAFGRNVFNGPVMVQLGAYVAVDKSLWATSAIFSQRGPVTTITDEFANRLFVGTSRGWDGNRLVFNGTSNAQQMMDPAPALTSQPLFERLTFERSDAQHFTRVYETETSTDGPWTTRSADSCARIAAAG